jgi:DNA-binding response OmpR family regulator
MNRERVLVVEDDLKLLQQVKDMLIAQGYEAAAVGSAEEALERVEKERPDLIILDISLPGIDGLTACRTLCGQLKLPVILLTAADAPELKITALGLGADDYVTKPFHPGELIARIKAVLRRAAASGEAAQSVIEAGPLRIDLEKREVFRDGAPIRLTKMEFDLLQELAIHADTVLTYEYLLRAVWGTSIQDVRTVHVHVCHLRRKLEGGPSGSRRIMPIPGVGYRFVRAD